MVVIINPINKTVTEIVNDPAALLKYYEKYKHRLTQKDIDLVETVFAKYL